MSEATKPMNLDEAAAYIGISKHTLYKYVQRREIPHVRIGNLIRFDPRVLNTWIFDENRIDPVSLERQKRKRPRHVPAAHRNAKAI